MINIEIVYLHLHSVGLTIYVTIFVQDEKLVKWVNYTDSYLKVKNI